MSEDLSSRFQTLHEIVAAAFQTLNRNMWDYVAGGTETETSLLRNRLALDQIAFRPRILRDVGKLDSSTSFMGNPSRLPVFLAPIGGLEAIADNGGIAMAEAAGEFGIPFFLSSISQTGLENVAAAGSGTKVFQLYPRGDAAWIDDHVSRAVAAGYNAFCLTVDSAHYSRRERDLANRFGKPWRGKALGMEYQAALNWKDIERFMRAHSLPLILKGILTAEDAVLACEQGVEAIVISNHGGRQLDHCQGSMEVLPEILSAVKGRTSVFVDGGFCRGSDVVKAMALGAQGVGLGKLLCFGLAAAGRGGVVRMLELLELEIVECLALLGVTDFGSLDASYVTKANEVCQPGMFSAFPLLDISTHRY